MPYTITLTDGSTFATIADGTINTSSSMTLVGQNFEAYGQFIDENFIHLLENFSNNTAPTDPIAGQLWWDKATGLLNVFNGTVFRSLSSAFASATVPSVATDGDLWFDTTTKQLKVYSGGSWTVVGPLYTQAQGVTGAIPATIVDTSSVEHTVVYLYARNSIVGIISKDSVFQPNTAIAGFSNIFPGITLSSLIDSNVPLFTGTSTNSQRLENILPSQFMRTDENTSTIGILSVLNNAGLTIGNTQQLKANVIGNNVQITNQMSGGNIALAVNVNGTLTTVLAINGTTGAPTAPTATSGTNTTQIATTAFVQGEKVSPTFTGTPIAPTAVANTNTTQIATTAFVRTAVINATGALGTMSTQNANAVAVTGGSLSGISASLIGTPTSPTAANGTSNTQIATTAFVTNTVENAKISPTFTGTPIAPTAVANTNTTQIATTAFVTTAVVNATGALGTMSTQNANAVAVTGGTINSLSVTALGTNGYGTKTVSTSAPSGGSDGDIWYQVA
jgi:hypothetical protein